MPFLSTVPTYGLTIGTFVLMVNSKIERNFPLRNYTIRSLQQDLKKKNNYFSPCTILSRFFVEPLCPNAWKHDYIDYYCHNHWTKPRAVRVFAHHTR